MREGKGEGAGKREEGGRVRVRRVEGSVRGYIYMFSLLRFDKYKYETKDDNFFFFLPA